MIRTAKAGDAAQIRAFWNTEIRDTLITFNSVEKTESDLVAMIEEKASAGLGFLVAEVDGDILGFATYGQFRGGIGYKHTAEHTIVLAPDARGRGVGRSLMAAIEQHARDMGFHTMWAGVSAGNPDGVVFHERVGYEKVAVLPEVGRKFDQWLDLVLMQKRL